MENTYFSQQCLDLIGSISKELMGRDLRLGTAESCTGGLLAALCTELPGSSRWFTGGVVAYANDIKENILRVPALLLREYGAVSGPVVEAMAAGALRCLGVHLSVAFSGIAGPDGGTREKPVGTVWVAVVGRTAQADEVPTPDNGYRMPGVRLYSQVSHFSGTRSAIRLQAVRTGLEMLARVLSETNNAPTHS